MMDPFLLSLSPIQVSFSSTHFCLTLNPIRKSKFFQKSRVEAQLSVLIQFTEFKCYKNPVIILRRPIVLCVRVRENEKAWFDLQYMHDSFTTYPGQLMTKTYIYDILGAF